MQDRELISDQWKSDRIRSFICSWYHDDEGELGQLYRSAVERDVPVIRQDMRELLRLLLSMQRPGRILEIGTAVGYSALFMSFCLPEAEITTLELDPVRAKEAREHFQAFGKESVIRLIEGDAAKVLETLPGPYDFAFIDAAKAQYDSYFRLLRRLVHPETVVVSDNVLQEGSILESHFSVEKRDRTIHDRMRDYLRMLTATPGLVTTILDVGDGAAITLISEEWLKEPEAI